MTLCESIDVRGAVNGAAEHWTSPHANGARLAPGTFVRRIVRRAGSEVCMGLPASQRKILGKIEIALRRSDPPLAGIFAVFSRLNHHEEMPETERLRARAAPLTGRYPGAGNSPTSVRRVRLRAAFLLPVALVAVISAALVSAGFPSSAKCAATKQERRTSAVSQQVHCPGLLPYPVYNSR